MTIFTLVYAHRTGSLWRILYETLCIVCEFSNRQCPMIIKFLQAPDGFRERSASLGRPETSADARASISEPATAAPEMKTDCIVAADLDERQYALARFAGPEFQQFQDYEDWLDFREGSLWGLRMAGIEVEMVAVDLVAFLSWCRTAAKSPAIATLDEFAALTKALAAGRREKNIRLA